MITVLVGHRGTGKTSLLARLARLRPGARCLDLDARIAAAEEVSIHAIFAERGEAAFRALEHRHLAGLVAEAGGRETFVALGAGFTGPPPAGVRCLWVRRDTDASGRIFVDPTDRPRLDPTLEPLEEFRGRFAAREARYRAWADEVWTLGEGFEDGDPAEARYFGGAPATTPAATPACITVLPEHVRPGAEGAARLAAWVARMRALGVATFELRDDLLEPDALAAACDAIDPALTLFSCRRPPANGAAPPPGRAIDRDLALGAGPHDAPPPSILSLHTREPGESVTAAAARLDAAAGPGVHRKLAVEVADLAELLEGHDWAAADAAGRSFLPRSPDGRWAWYRILRAAETRLNFVREGAGSAADQPTVAQWLRFRPGDGRFAAILGDPVGHSRTPATHHAFFATRGRPVLAVRLDGPDRTAQGIERLTRLGLRHAAVTAPLKGLARTVCARVTDTARALDAVNTLRFDEGEGRWHGANTDREGFEALRPMAGEAGAGEAGAGEAGTEEAENEEAETGGAETGGAGAGKVAAEGSGAVAVWGGGGTRAMLADVFPGAAFHAARTGAHTGGPVVSAPEIVIWATGRAGAVPPETWRPARVIDLDYREDAPGRAYALGAGARYTSGLAMFERQAAAQRAWWESFENEVC